MASFVLKVFEQWTQVWFRSSRWMRAMWVGMFEGRLEIHFSKDWCTRATTWSVWKMSEPELRQKTASGGGGIFGLFGPLKKLEKGFNF